MRVRPLQLIISLRRFSTYHFHRKELASSPDRTSSVHDAEDFAENVKPKTLGLTDTRPKGGVRKALATEKPSNWVPFVSSIHLRPIMTSEKR